MSEHLFLFISWLCGLLLVYYVSIDFMKIVLLDRKIKIITKTACLKKNLKFAELDRQKSYSEYVNNKEKNNNWRSEAKNFYLICYEQKKNAYQSCFEEIQFKKKLIERAKRKEKQMRMLEFLLSQVINKIKQQNFDIDLNFDKAIENII